MNLHEHKNEFQELITLVAIEKHIPESAVERDYYIVMMLQKLEQSEYAEQCVFKGGTSLSKCYPGSIERFSEDIDLTFLGIDLPDKQCSKNIKRIEAIMTQGMENEPVPDERSNRSKSLYAWFGNRDNQIKLEIGSSVRPDPYSKHILKTYIQEYLESNGHTDSVTEYELTSVQLNVLDLSRTFIDKLMSVKRHAICGTLGNKVRHIYDVVRLYQLSEIQSFLQDKDELKRLIGLTKETDSYYIGKRNISVEYNPKEPYSFEGWKHYFNNTVKQNYEELHKTLLYTDAPQNFDLAIETFTEISRLFAEIGE